jgi:hypothetical protein
MQNEDGNPNLVIIDPKAHSQKSVYIRDRRRMVEVMMTLHSVDTMSS